MKNDSDFNPFMVIIFKILTFLQEATLKQSNVEFYYSLTKLHFRLYFGKKLVDEAVNNSREFQVAQHRHGCMVVSKLYGDSGSGFKKSAFRRAKDAFQKNLLLEADL